MSNVLRVLSQIWQSKKLILIESRWGFFFFFFKDFFFFLKISCGRNVLLRGKFVEVKIWFTLVEVLTKNKLVRYAHSCAF